MPIFNTDPPSRTQQKYKKYKYATTNSTKTHQEKLCKKTNTKRNNYIEKNSNQIILPIIFDRVTKSYAQPKVASNVKEKLIVSNRVSTSLKSNKVSSSQSNNFLRHGFSIDTKNDNNKRPSILRDRERETSTQNNRYSSYSHSVNKLLHQSENIKGRQMKAYKKQMPRITALNAKKQQKETQKKYSISVGKDRNQIKRDKDFCKINQELFFECRQNYLHGKFTQRKSRLEKITKENKRIYERINSQKSPYSRKQLNESYQSNASLSRRLSNSKISRRSSMSNCSISSRKSIKSNKNTNSLKTRQKECSNPQEKHVIVQKKVNELDNQQIERLSTLFTLKSSLKFNPSTRKQNPSDNKMRGTKENCQPFIQPQSNKNLNQKRFSNQKKQQPRKAVKTGLLTTIDQNVAQNKFKKPSKQVKTITKNFQQNIKDFIHQQCRTERIISRKNCLARLY